MSQRHANGIMVLGGLLGVMLAIASPTWSGAGVPALSGAPHIVARPNNVMVNTTVKLTGTGFAPNTKLELGECGSTSWSVPQNPCNTTRIPVKTNQRGEFKHSFTATLCPRSGTWIGHPITEEKCYVGDPTPAGIDVINLVGHVKIIVTYP